MIALIVVLGVVLVCIRRALTVVFGWGRGPEPGDPAIKDGAVDEGHNAERTHSSASLNTNHEARIR